MENERERTMRDNIQMGSVVGRMITINETDIAPNENGLVAPDWAAIAKVLVAKGLAASALPPAPNEGKPDDGADASTEPETGEAEATGHPAAGAVTERAAPNKVAVDAGAKAAVVVEALVPNPANETMGAEAGAAEGIAEDDENENGEATVTAGTGGATAATPTSPKVTWVNDAPRKQKQQIESKGNGNYMGKCELWPGKNKINEFVPQE